MIDKQRLSEFLTEYRAFLASEEWDPERFKWEAIKTFQDNWDINAEDFPGMLDKALSKTGILLTSRQRYSKSMILELARFDTEEVRSMFIALFDENRDVIERMEEFKNRANELKNKSTSKDKDHYQQENASSTYLWLQYPDKYYIYQYKEASYVGKAINYDFNFKKGHNEDNVRHFFDMYNEMCEFVIKDSELINLFKSRLTDKCYVDPYFKTLTIDVGYFIRKKVESAKETEIGDKWLPADYSPNISVDEWVNLLNDTTVFYESSLEIIKRIKDFGGAATCKQLSVKYGKEPGFYNSGGSSLGKRVANRTSCPVNMENGELKWWQIPFVGKKAGKDVDGSYIWKLRDELAEALEHVDLSDVKLYDATSTETDIVQSSDKSIGYWWLNASPQIWRLSEMPVGESQNYTLFNTNNKTGKMTKRRIFQHFLDARVGDMVIGYETTPVKKIVSICKVSKEQDGKEIWFKKCENLVSPIDYDKLKDIPELAGMEFFHNATGSLFKLTQKEYDKIIELIRKENSIPFPDEIKSYDKIESPERRTVEDGDNVLNDYNNEVKPQEQEEPDVQVEPYTKSDFLGDVYMSEEQYDRLVSVLKNKKNIILQGAPGVGKTYAAQRLCYSIMGERNQFRIKFVQFHQNYSYEDFVLGYKPKGESFELKNGIFYTFCQKAARDPERAYFFIIDEINRGNLSKIFGELLMLIENDHRGEVTTLAYSGETFSVPKNLYIIGMMNTADRSLAMIDYALRRRFSFIDMKPAFESEGFLKYQKSLDSDKFNSLINNVKELNKAISADKSLGKGFCIGHSYFCNWIECTDAKMRDVIDFEIMPTLEEYWFDDDAKLKQWKDILQSIF